METSYVQEWHILVIWIPNMFLILQPCIPATSNSVYFVGRYKWEWGTCNEQSCVPSMACVSPNLSLWVWACLEVECLKVWVKTGPDESVKWKSSSGCSGVSTTWLWTQGGGHMAMGVGTAVKWLQDRITWGHWSSEVASRQKRPGVEPSPKVRSCQVSTSDPVLQNGQRTNSCCFRLWLA